MHYRGGAYALCAIALVVGLGNEEILVPQVHARVSREQYVGPGVTNPLIQSRLRQAVLQAKKRSFSQRPQVDDPNWVARLTQCERLRRELWRAGWQAHEMNTIMAIAQAESGCYPRAVHVTKKEKSLGSLQINVRTHTWVSDVCAMDYACAARAGRKIYLDRAARTGDGFEAWTVYQEGLHKLYLLARR